MAKIPPKSKNVRNTPKSIIYSFTKRLKIEFLYKNGVAQVFMALIRGSLFLESKNNIIESEIKREKVFHLRDNKF